MATVENPQLGSKLGGLRNKLPTKGEFSAKSAKTSFLKKEPRPSGAVQLFAIFAV